VKAALTVERLIAEAVEFAQLESRHDEPSLYGVTDGKAVGTYLEHKFITHLMDRYSFASGNSASGIDIPGLNVDIKVTSIKLPQSSSPYRSARQKIYGLGYSLIVFVYEKTDDESGKTSRLAIKHTIFIDKEQTADYRTTRGLRDILGRNGNREEIVSFLLDCDLLVSEVEAGHLADEILRDTPPLGYLTVSNAYQWRLKYSRAIGQAGQVTGLTRIT
jgi:hypothetical protein